MTDGNTASQANLHACMLAIQEVARRGAAAARFQSRTEERLLQLIVDATVSLFQAQAASIALFMNDPDRLEYRVSGGPESGDVVGMSVAPTQGIVGYVYLTGESLALTDMSQDPRFDRTIAEQTGYTPRSVAAVPLVTEDQVVGDAFGRVRRGRHIHPHPRLIRRRGMGKRSRRQRRHRVEPPPLRPRRRHPARLAGRYHHKQHRSLQ